MSRVHPAVARAGSLVMLLALVAAATGLALLIGDKAMDRTVVGVLVDLVIVVGIYVFIGLTGVFSFGHLGFVAIGAYAVGVLTVPVGTKEVLFRSMPDALDTLHLAFVPAVLVGGLVAALCALVVAVPLSRMAGLTAALATLSILVMVYTVASNWDQVTNGAQGMPAIPTNTTLGVAFVSALVAISAVWAFQESRLGLQLRATREDAVAARAIGIRVGRERGIALVVSAFVVGVGGGLFAQLQGSLTPDSFYLATTFMLIAMLVVGGMTSLSGAVVGTIVVSALRELLRHIEAGTSVGPLDVPGRPGLTEVGLAVVLLVILALRPSGITGGRELSPAAAAAVIGRVRRRLGGGNGLSTAAAGAGRKGPS